MNLIDFAMGYSIGRIKKKEKPQIPRIEQKVEKYVEIDILNHLTLSVEDSYILYKYYDIITIYKNGITRYYKPVEVNVNDLVIDKTFVLYTNDEIYE